MTPGCCSVSSLATRQQLLAVVLTAVWPSRPTVPESSLSARHSVGLDWAQGLGLRSQSPACMQCCIWAWGQRRREVQYRWSSRLTIMWQRPVWLWSSNWKSRSEVWWCSLTLHTGCWWSQWWWVGVYFTGSHIHCSYLIFIHIALFFFHHFFTCMFICLCVCFRATQHQCLKAPIPRLNGQWMTSPISPITTLCSMSSTSTLPSTSSQWVSVASCHIHVRLLTVLIKRIHDTFVFDIHKQTRTKCLQMSANETISV